jgi:hypothetical protein
MYRRFVKLKIKFWWTVEDIYDNVCKAYGKTNNNWYPSFKSEMQLIVHDVVKKWRPIIKKLVN